ncbi:hypothetical protein D3C81_1014280 [compost metagenome]
MDREGVAAAGLQWECISCYENAQPLFDRHIFFAIIDPARRTVDLEWASCFALTELQRLL